MNEKRSFKAEWRDEFLMDFVMKDTKEMMTCMICWQTFDCSGNSSPRLDTIKKHHKRKHDEMKGYDSVGKKWLVGNMSKKRKSHKMK